MLGGISARKRRRLVWLACLAAVAGIVAAIVVVVPTGHRIAATPTAERSPTAAGTPTPPAAEHQVRLSAATRRKIDATLDRFVPAGVERRDPAAAWSLAGPGLRAGTTHADWLHGRLPVYPFPAQGTTFHGWTLRYAYPDRVGLDLLVRARPDAKGKLQAIAFTAVLRRVGSRWLVDSWIPAALFGRNGAAPVESAKDYGPSAGSGSNATHGQIGARWVYLPLAVLGGSVVIVPVGLLLAGWLRGRRARSRYEAANPGRQGMPSLPPSLRRPSAD